MSKRAMKELLPPGPGAPAAIQLIAMWKRPAVSLERLRRRYGKRVTVKLPFQPPLVILSDPDEIKELFTAPPDAVHPGEGAGILEPVVGRHSVILLDEAQHVEQRKLMLPAFHGERMQRLAGLMTELVERELATWPREQPLELHPRLQRVTLEIILRAVLGLEQGRALDELRDALTGVLAFAESPLSVIQGAPRKHTWLPPVRRLNALFKHTDGLIFNLIAERRAEHDEAGAEREDILAMLLDARHADDSPMSPQELRDELVTAIVAGHETTASQLAWAFECLARHPAQRGRLTAEIDLGESDEYLTATVHELLRLRPVLPNAAPRLTKQPIEIGGFRYPAGVALVASVILVHHDPDIYPEPFAFRPERFLGGQPGTHTWLPFGGGRRRCLGASFALLEMKIVLRAVLQRCEVTPTATRPETTRRRSITFSPSHGATVLLADRESDGAPAPARGQEVPAAA